MAEEVCYSCSGAVTPVVRPHPLINCDEYKVSGPLGNRVYNNFRANGINVDVHGADNVKLLKGCAVVAYRFDGYYLFRFISDDEKVRRRASDIWT